MIVAALSVGSQSKGTFKGAHGSVKSSLEIERCIVVDQQPIGRSPRSTPASYLGIWDEVRKLYAETLEAKSRGWGASFFSHNTGKGRCPTCKGQGELTLEMSFWQRLGFCVRAASAAALPRRPILCALRS